MEQSSRKTSQNSIFQRLKRFFFKNLSVTDGKAWNPSLWNFRAAQTSAGVNVTEETALTYSAVFNATTLYSNTLSTLPLRLIKEKSNKKRPATEKDLYGIMHTRFNRYMTAQIGREVLMAHVLLWGNAYAEIVRNQVGDIKALWPIPPNKVRPEMENGEMVYRITVDSEIITLPRERVLHIPGLGFDGFVGYSVIALARDSIGLSMATEQFGSNFFSNGTHPGIIVSHPGKLGDTASKNLRESLQQTYSGLGNEHRLLLLEEAMKVEKIGIPPEDAQFLGTRQFQIPEIARWFNLPPHKLKDLTKSSFNNIESEQISFVTDSILPWVIRFETNYNTQLLSEKDTKQGFYFKHSVEGLLRGDAKSRSFFYTKMFSIGAMSINEIRAKEDMDPIVNGDKHFVPLNMAPLDKIEEVIANDNSTPETIEPEDEQPGIKQKGKRAAEVISLR